MVRTLLIAALLAGLPAASPAQVGQMPTLDPKYGEGCWVRFYDEPALKGPLGRLAGAHYINSISGPGLIGGMNEEDFFGRARSVAVGPEARLIVYAERGFRQELFSLEPGREVKDLRALGFPKKVASMKIVCEYRR